MLFKNASQKSDLSHVYLPPKKFIINLGALGTAAISKGGCFQPHPTQKAKCLLPEGSCLLVDFGEELSGGIRLVFHQNEGTKIRIRFGESAAEALPPSDKSETKNLHSVRDTVLSVPSLGSLEYGECGFRFVSIFALDGEISLIGLFARADYLSLEWLGGFDSSDKRLNEIWRISARTLHLNMQNLLYDGIKCNRLVSVGGMHQVLKGALSLFGDTKCIRDTLDFAKNTTPKNAWMGSYPSFSLRWVLMQYDLYMWSGDKKYLEENMDYLLGILAQFAKSVSADGSVMGLSSFIDWSMHDNTSANEAAFSALATMAFERGAFLCRELGTEAFFAVAERLEEYAKRLFRHSSWSVNRQAVAMQVLSGQKNAEDALAALSKDTVHNISTSLGYYVLAAMSLGGGTKTALDAVKKYWGAMLDLGATTFFESFDIKEVEGTLPPLKIDTPPTDSYKNLYLGGTADSKGGYERSLAHAHASSPLAWISEYLLGIKILEPGCKRVEVKPRLAGLSRINGKFPTPYGIIEVSATRSGGEIQTEITAPDEIEIVT